MKRAIDTFIDVTTEEKDNHWILVTVVSQTKKCSCTQVTHWVLPDAKPAKPELDDPSWDAHQYASEIYDIHDHPWRSLNWYMPSATNDFTVETEIWNKFEVYTSGVYCKQDGKVCTLQRILGDICGGRMLKNNGYLPKTNLRYTYIVSDDQFCK